MSNHKSTDRYSLSNEPGVDLHATVKKWLTTEGDTEFTATSDHYYYTSTSAAPVAPSWKKVIIFVDNTKARAAFSRVGAHRTWGKIPEVFLHA